MSKIEIALASLAEAFLPSLPEEAKAYRARGDEALARLFEYPGDDGPKAYQMIAKEAQALCIQHLPADKWKDLKFLLTLLTTRLGSLVLGGRQCLTLQPPFCCPFTKLLPARREAILLSWKNSRLKVFKQILKALQGLLVFIAFAAHDEDGKNDLWPLIGYPGVDPKKPLKPSLSKQASEAKLLGSITDLSGDVARQSTDLAAILQQSGHSVLTPEATDSCSSVVLECDAVIVGSGAGGSVASAVLAQAGLKVIIVEKGNYTKAEELTTLEKDAYDGLYERGGLMMASEDGGMNIMAGATVGGGTRVNWCVSFKTPAHVRKEWAEVNGLPAFNTEEYEQAMDAVCKRLGVATGVEHNKANKLLWQGLVALQADVEEMPRNCAKSGQCGHCTHGCASGEKQDTTATFLADAAQAGAKILTGCFVRRILTEEGGAGGRQKRARGVEVQVGGSGRVLEVRAPLVMAAGGSLHSPALLLRSGITCQGNVGRHLHLHCGAAVAACFPKKDQAEDITEGRINLWEGPQMSTYSRQFADWGGGGYGPLVSMTAAHPGLLAAGSPYEGAVKSRERMGKLPWMAGSCTYIRDRDSGWVVIDAAGQPRVHYWPSTFDQLSIVKGIELGIRAMVAAGAEEVFTGQRLPKPQLIVERKPDGSVANQEAVEAYIADVNAQGVKPAEIPLFSLHQMGSCRMGASIQDSVADGSGHCWECSGLYIADASAFPTASGVNPMITVESIAWMVSTRIAASRRI